MLEDLATFAREQLDAHGQRDSGGGVPLGSVWWDQHRRTAFAAEEPDAEAVFLGSCTLWPARHWTRAAAETPPPRRQDPPHIAISASGIVVLRSGRPRYVFRGIFSAALLHDIRDALRAAAPALLEKQDHVNQEIGGVVLCGASGSLDRIQVVSCEGLTGDPTSSDPHCGGRRRCTNATAMSNVPDRILGEWHTHPRQHVRVGDRLFTVPAPPSGSDLYQCALSRLKNEHGLSAVVAYDGVYFATTPVTVAHRLSRELDHFYRHGKIPRAEALRSTETCRQPLERFIRPQETPLLDSMLVALEREFDSLMRTAVDRPKRRKIEETYAVQDPFAHLVPRYIHLVRASTGISLEHFPP